MGGRVRLWTIRAWEIGATRSILRRKNNSVDQDIFSVNVLKEVEEGRSQPNLCVHCAAGAEMCPQPNTVFAH